MPTLHREYGRLYCLNFNESSHENHYTEYEYCYIHSVLYVPFTFIGNSVLSIADYIKSTSGRQI